MSAVILDNDECLGYFGTISGLYIRMLGSNFYQHKLKADNPIRVKAETEFRNMAVEMLKTGFARPGLKEFFKLLKELKKRGIIQKVIMYTSASRNSGRQEADYVNWVGMLRSIFEDFAGHQRGLPTVYDLDHSGRSDEHPQMRSADGATLKNVGMVLKRAGITDPSALRSVFFLDDRPHNIYVNSRELDEAKLVRLGVTPYFYLPKYEPLMRICKKYDDVFSGLGITRPSLLLEREYRDDMEDLRDEGKTNKIGGKIEDNDELELADLNNILAALPPA